MPLSLTPIIIGGVEFANRIFLSPMCQYSSVDGYANDWHFVHYGSRAVGGAGLVMLEATAVSPEGRISPDDLGIWLDGHIDGLEKIATFIHKHGSKAGIQLAHAGRKASTYAPWKGGGQLSTDDGSWDTIAPSAIPFDDDDASPSEMSHDDIAAVVHHFAHAARRATEAGYDVLEIHAAHGYLIHQFLSPIANHRADAYGGSFDNRIRLLREIIAAVRQEMHDRQALFVRISATDYVDNGWDLGQSISLAQVLYDDGVHLIDVSSGAMVPNVAIDVRPGYQVPFASAIKRESSISVGAVGVLYEPKQIEEVLASEQADVVLVGREMLRDPYFVVRATKELKGENGYPNQYLRAYRK